MSIEQQHILLSNSVQYTRPTAKRSRDKNERWRPSIDDSDPLGALEGFGRWRQSDHDWLALKRFAKKLWSRYTLGDDWRICLSAFIICKAAATNCQKDKTVSDLEVILKKDWKSQQAGSQRAVSDLSAQVSVDESENESYRKKNRPNKL